MSETDYFLILFMKECPALIATNIERLAFWSYFKFFPLREGNSHNQEVILGDWITIFYLFIDYMFLNYVKI